MTRSWVVVGVVVGVVVCAALGCSPDSVSDSRAGLDTAGLDTAGLDLDGIGAREVAGPADADMEAMTGPDTTVTSDAGGESDVSLDDVAGPDVHEPPDDHDASDGGLPGADLPGFDVAPPTTAWLAVITGPEALSQLSVGGGPVKYLSVLEGATPPSPIEAGCLFQDMHLWEYHILFLRSFLELADLPYDDYLTMVLRPATRVLWGGAVQARPQVAHPSTGMLGIVTYVVYSDPGPASLSVADLAEVDAQLEACMPYAADRLVFVPSDEYQRQLMVSAAAALVAADVDVMAPEALPP